MNLKLNIIKSAFILLLFCGIVSAQQSFIISGGGVSKGDNRLNNMTALIGQTLTGEAKSSDGKMSAVFGYYTFMNMAPRPMVVSGSKGDFSDKIEISWKVDPLSPAADEGFNIYRDGRLLETLPNNQFVYQDFNVLAGTVYEYSVSGINEFGEGGKGKDVGFINPNGVITGRVITKNGNPAIDRKITLTPNLGFALKTNEQSWLRVEANDAMVSDSFSVEAWVKIGDTYQWNKIFDTRTNDNTNGIYILTTNKQNGQGKGVIFGTQNSGSRYEVSHIWDDDEWHHIACAYDGTRIRLYIDGSLQASGNAAYSAPKNGFYIARGFTGWIDDVRFWSISRKPEDIALDINRSLTGEEDGLIAYWKFDEGNGPLFFDLTDHKMYGKMGSAEWTTGKAPVYNMAYSDDEGYYQIKGIYYGSGTTFTVTPSKDSPSGAALHFNGSSEYVDISQKESLDLADAITIEAWINPEAFTNSAAIVNRITQNDRGGYSLEMDGNGGINFFISINGRWESVYSGSRFLSNEWQHVAATFDGKKICLYRNGELIRTLSAFGKIDNPAGTKMYIGKSVLYNAFYKGLMDEVKVWNRAKTAEEVKSGMNTNEGSGLTANWKFNEGNGLLTRDLTGNGNDGQISSLAMWSDQVHMEESFQYEFGPSERIVTLNPSNTSRDEVNFTDLSLFAVAGYVRYYETSCFADSVAIYVDGEEYSPPIYTDSTGYFVADFEPGSSGTLSAHYKNHEFSPDKFEFSNISSPISGVAFNDITKRILTGEVAGGNCRYPILPSQGHATLTVTSISECYDTTITLTDQHYEIANLPPIEFVVSVEHPDPFIKFDNKIVSLEDSNNTLDMIYYAPLEVGIVGLPKDECDNIVMQQGGKYGVTIQVFETYINGSDTNICRIKKGDLRILDDVSDVGDTTFSFTDYFTNYDIYAGLPNIVPPYEKTFKVIAKDTLGRQASTEAFVVVLGKKPRESNFITKSPQIPLVILRDPPGDQSYSYISKGTSIVTSMSIAYFNEYTPGVNLSVYLGPNWEVTTGLGVEAKVVNWDVIADMSSTWLYQHRNETDSTTQFMMTAKEDISTAQSDLVVGQGGDLYFGAAVNLKVGWTDILEKDGCDFKITEDLIIDPVGFSTEYLYTENHIKNFLLPLMQKIYDDTTQTQDVRDSMQVSIGMWNSILGLNDSLKQDAQYNRNVSFSGGTTLQHEETTETSTTITTVFENSFIWDFAADFGFKYNDLGFSAGPRITISTTSHIQKDTTHTKTETIGYFLQDDDVDDYFTVNVKTDPAYGTPVFETISGASSCPWESNTAPREGVQITPHFDQAVNLMPNEPAVFQVQLGNTSQTNEDYVYILSVMHETNPNGAIVKLNGQPVVDAMPIEVHYGQPVTATLTIERGPIGYHYENIGIEFASSCESAIAEALGADDPTISDQAYFTVDFLEPCAEVEISSPVNSWMITTGTGNQLQVVLTDYLKSSDAFTGIEVQYRKRDVIGKSGGRAADIFHETGGIPTESGFSSSSAGDEILAGNWTVYETIAREDLTDHYYLTYLDVSQWKDGDYEIRAVTKCSNPDLIEGVSTVIPGKIDRKGPEVLLAPSPADGILNAQDDILITFNEPIEREKVIKPTNISLKFKDDDSDIDFDFSVGENSISITPNIQNSFMENRSILASVNHIEDKYGNVTDGPIEWEFVVDRSPIKWDNGEIKTVKNETDEFNAVRKLWNTGGKTYPFTIIEVPDWLKVEPMTGEIAAADKVEFTFTVSSNLPPGVYSDTVYAKTELLGSEPMILKITVPCNQLEWVVNPADYQYSMAITGTVMIGGESAADQCDVVSAFVGDEVRGVATLEYLHQFDTGQQGDYPYQVFLTVYSNSENGENVHLRIDDASKHIVWSVTNSAIPFVADAVVGSSTDPLVITASNRLHQKIAMNKGWTWFSLNLRMQDSAPDSVLASVAAVDNDLIKDQTSFAQYSSGTWIGSLTEVDSSAMYMINLTGADMLEFEGAPVSLDSSAVELSAGWNWISYLPQSPETVNDALSSLSASDDDFIKSQYEYAIYDQNLGWLGSLKYMRPGLGYKMKVQSAGTITYPQPTGKANLAKGLAKDGKPDAPAGALPNDWAVNVGQFEFNMSITGAVVYSGNDPDVNDAIGAFSGGECRGTARLTHIESIDKYVFFLTAFGNGGRGEKLEFRFFDDSEGSVIPVLESLDFTPNGIVGSVNDPYKWNMLLTGLFDENGIPTEYQLLQNYPNPFNPTTNITYALPEGAFVELQIFDILGREVKTLVSREETAGYHTVTWNGTYNSGAKAVSGIYLYKLSTKKFNRAMKLILMK